VFWFNDDGCLGQILMIVPERQFFVKHVQKQRRCVTTTQMSRDTFHASD
jgi:hypothetical protein